MFTGYIMGHALVEKFPLQLSEHIAFWCQLCLLHACSSQLFQMSSLKITWRTVCHLDWIAEECGPQFSLVTYKMATFYCILWIPWC